MKKLVTLFAIAGLVFALAPATCAFATDYEWAGEASALGETAGLNWTDAANWSNVTSSTYNDGYPDGIGDWAIFNMTNDSHPNITITGAITLGGWTNVRNNVNMPPWEQDRLVGTVTGAGSITFDNGAGDSYLSWVTENVKWRDSGDQAFSVDIILAGDLHHGWSTERDRTLNSTITGTGDLYLTWLATDSTRWRIGGTAPNTYSGDTYINIGRFYGATWPIVELSKDGAVAGDVYMDREEGYWNLVETNAQLTVTSSGGAEDRIPDTSSVFLKSFNAGAEHTILDLDAGVDETVAGLYLDGAAQLPGIWGATGSTPIPDYINNNFFTGTGVLRVVIPPPDGAVLIIR